MTEFTNDEFPDQINVSLNRGCMRALNRLDEPTQSAFLSMSEKLISNATRKGLNIEPIEGAMDKTMKSIRVNQQYRAVGSLRGVDLLFLFVGPHDEAYRWARRRRVVIDDMKRVRIVEMVEETEATTPPTWSTTPSATPHAPSLFDPWTDAELKALGLTDADLRRARTITSDDQLDAEQDAFDPVSHNILSALAMGYGLDEVPALLGIEHDGAATTVGADVDAASDPSDETFADALRTPASRATIFVPEDQKELRRVLEGDMAAWRIFLHPEQRRLVARKTSGPTLVRGGAGTGKTVVAMHRAKVLADRIAAVPARSGRKVLFTTFTTTLAHDIEANLKTLCPEHLTRGAERIEVRNLDAWVRAFLRRSGFEKEIAFPGDDKVEAVWSEALADAELPEGLTEAFIKAEWSDVVQAQGLMDRKGYLRASRAGRGTALDAKKRAAIWPIFERFRAEMIDRRIIEPEDAYREARLVLSRQAPGMLPYDHVVVDEAQDFGRNAFKLIRAIVPPPTEEGVSDADSLFIVGDAHQRIYGRQLSLGACGIAVRGRSTRLRLNYRTTESIRAYAVSILEGVSVDDLDDNLDTLAGYRSLMKGPDPDLTGYATRTEELAALVARLQGYAPNVLAEVGVIARTNAILDAVQAALEKAGIEAHRLSKGAPDNPACPGVRLATAHRAKGLEFRDVHIVCVSEGLWPPSGVLERQIDAAAIKDMEARERSLFHVAATRAKARLFVSWSGSISYIIHQS